jgi:hypothetical protein
MPQPREKLDLSLKPLSAKCNAAFAIENLQGNGSIMPTVLREVNCRHSTLSELGGQRVMTGKSVAELYGNTERRCCRHGL